MTETFETMCCGTGMHPLGGLQCLDWDTHEVKRWLCLDCGRYIDLVDAQFDEEILNEYKQDIADGFYLSPSHSQAGGAGNSSTAEEGKPNKQASGAAAKAAEHTIPESEPACGTTERGCEKHG